MRERQPLLPRVVVVHQGSVEQGKLLLHKLWPDVPAVSDPERRLYSAFGLRRGGVSAVLGPRTWMAGLRALTKGHFIGKPVGDPWLMPGMFLAAGDRVLWSHPFEHAGDLPDEATLLAAVRMSLAASA